MVEPKIKTEPTPEPNSGANSSADDVKNRIVLQQIQLSQIRDRMQPTVPDQGIVFDDNNNPWMRPKGQDNHEEDKKLNKPPKKNGDSGGRGGPPGRYPGGPPNDPNDDGGEDEGDDEDAAKHDPFKPRFQLRDISTVSTARSLEVKARHTERKFQQIVEFICQNLAHKLSIPDGAKGTHLDTKHMKKYDGTPSREVLWEWLWSIVFSY